MWSAIIQAIDHAMGRIQKGMSAGIDVANSQHGGTAPATSASNEEQVDTSSSILSDEKAKEAKSVSAKTAAANIVSGWKKARNYGTNLSKGFANAGAIATGQGKQYEIDNPVTVDFSKDITKDFKADDSTNTGKSK